MKKWLIAALIILIAIFGAWFFLSSEYAFAPEAAPETSDEVDKAPTSATGTTHTMVLGENGYTPEDITIELGDTIVFSTTEGKAFWPASDVHPTHRIFPEFDPKQPVPANESWSFTFERVGEWKYHDHLAPFFSGTITVVERAE